MDSRDRSADALLIRAASYRRFLPDWPALAESFEREAQAMREGKPFPAPPPPERKDRCSP